MIINKEDFNKYKKIQNSGVTNMFNIKLVIELSGLSREQILFIMDNYNKLENTTIDNCNIDYKKLCKCCKDYNDTWTINDFCPKCQELLNKMENNIK